MHAPRELALREAAIRAGHDVLEPDDGGEMDDALGGEFGCSATLAARLTTPGIKARSGRKGRKGARIHAQSEFMAAVMLDNVAPDFPADGSTAVQLQIVDIQFYHL